MAAPLMAGAFRARERSPSASAARTASAISVATSSWASEVDAPRCGVRTRLGADRSGESASRGSFPKTSRAAPASWPDSRASASAASSTTPPRATLTRNAPSFIRVRASASIIPRVASVRGTCSESTSARPSTVSRSSARSTCRSLARSAVRYGSNATTRIPKARQRFATSPPMRPAPTSPRVRPRSSTPLKRDRAHSPERIDASAAATRRTMARTSANVSSAAETVLPAGALRTAIPRSVAASRSMLSTPTPALPITRSILAPARRSASTVVALRTTSPWAPSRAPVKAGSDESSTRITWNRSSERRGSSPESETLSATRTV